jgi:hypothetical protein
LHSKVTAKKIHMIRRLLDKIIPHQHLMEELPISFNIRIPPSLRTTPSIPARKLLLLLFVLLLLQQSLASTAAPPLLVG